MTDWFLAFQPTMPHRLIHLIEKVDWKALLAITGINWTALIGFNILIINEFLKAGAFIATIAASITAAWLGYLRIKEKIFNRRASDLEEGKTYTLYNPKFDRYLQVKILKRTDLQYKVEWLTWGNEVRWETRENIRKLKLIQEIK